MSLGRIGMSAAALLALSACGGPSGSDAGRPDAGQVSLPPLAANEEVAEAFVPIALDYACLGVRSRPPSDGAPVSTTFQLRDFQDDFPVDATEVWLFSDNVIANECVAPNCQSFTTNGAGDGTVTLPASSWYAYRVLPKMGLSRMTTVFGVFQYNEPAPASAGMAVTGNSVSGSTIDLIPALLGISRTAELAIVAGRIEDCSGGFVQNAIIRMYDGDGNEVVSGELNDDPHFHYFNGRADSNLPDQTETRSNADGLYVLVQIDVLDDRPYRVEAWGNLGGELTQIGCETARIFPNAVTILNMTPRRSDAPAGCQ